MVTRTGAPAPGAPAPADAERARHQGMVRVPGGEFLIGSDDFYPEERPAHRVSVAPFWADAHPVTNAEFQRFVEATSYLTEAEQRPDPRAYPGVDASLLVAGSLLFRRPDRPVGLSDHRAWWEYVPGACWRRPEGPGSDLRGRDEHPVVHVTHADAAAYAAWAGKALPTEAEWEVAARGGLEGAVYPWGDEFALGGQYMANSWQGEFPWRNLALDGYEGTSPVGSFPPNGYGLYDVAGNVWEWTTDLFGRHTAAGNGGARYGGRACCSPQRQGAGADEAAAIPRRVIKGGSHLCAPNYCLRYRPAARQGHEVDSSTSHLGFRCVIRGGAEPSRA